MTINDQIRSALEPIGWPIVADNMSPGFSKFFVFNYTSLPDNFGDNEPQHERYLVQIHLFAPHKENTVRVRKQCKQCIFEAGFTFPSMVDASDETGQHWVFEFEVAVEVYG